jgi:hypothetical protein
MKKLNPSIARPMSRYLVAALIGMSSISVNARSGSELLRMCESGELTADWGYCVGFVRGVVDQHSEAGLKRQFCVPPAAYESQLAKVAFKSLKDHPERLHFSASSLVRAAMAESFPCN